MGPAEWGSLAAGAALCVFSAWQLAGRTRNARAWLRKPGLRVIVNTVFLWPAAGVTLACLGLIGLVRDIQAVAVPVAVIAVVALGALFYWGVLAFPFPLRLVPRWARAEAAQRKGQARRSAP